MALKLCCTLAKENGQNKYVKFQNEYPQGNQCSEEKDKSGGILEVKAHIKIQTPCTNENVRRYIAYAI